MNVYNKIWGNTNTELLAFHHKILKISFTFIFATTSHTHETLFYSRDVPLNITIKTKGSENLRSLIKENKKRRRSVLGGQQNV